MIKFVCDSQEVLSNLRCTGGAIVTVSVDSTVALVSDSLLTALTSNTQFNTDEQHNVQLFSETVKPVAWMPR